MNKFDAKSLTVLITGASQGLGRYLASTFWNHGHNLILVSRNLAALEALVIELKSFSMNDSLLGNQLRTIFVYRCDLSDPLSISDLINKVFSEHACIDILINNAGIQGPLGKSADIWASNPRAWLEAIQVDLLAPIEISSRLVPLLAKSDRLGKGSIINISGGGATAPRANFSAYATAKTGLIRFSETFAEEVKELGVRVNCIAPGIMKTAMLQEVLDQGPKLTGIKEFETAREIMSLGESSMRRVANLALFLAGENSAGVTGKLISAIWDNWERLPEYVAVLDKSDLFTLRRIAGRDRAMSWADI